MKPQNLKKISMFGAKSKKLETAPRGRGAPKAKASSIVVTNLKINLHPRSKFAISHLRGQLGSV